MSLGVRVNLDSVVEVKPGLVTAPMDDKLVMLDLAKGKYYGMDDIATAIWTAMANPVRVDDLCTHLMSRFDVDEETCRADTLDFLNQLHDEGLLKVHD